MTGRVVEYPTERILATEEERRSARDRHNLRAGQAACLELHQGAGMYCTLPRHHQGDHEALAFTGRNLVLSWPRQVLAVAALDTRPPAV